LIALSASVLPRPLLHGKLHLQCTYGAQLRQGTVRPLTGPKRACTLRTTEQPIANETLICAPAPARYQPSGQTQQPGSRLESTYGVCLNRVEELVNNCEGIPCLGCYRCLISFAGAGLESRLLPRGIHTRGDLLQQCLRRIASQIVSISRKKIGVLHLRVKKPLVVQKIQY